ncbi:uncharacterized protein LOC144689206 [Cetorhinus maximus]
MKQGLDEFTHQWTVLLLLCLTPAISAVWNSITARCTETATLPCTATRLERHHYRAVSWYKMIDGTNRTGIIRKSANGVHLYKDFNRSVNLTENNSLSIVHVTEEDAGIYRCSLFASLGGTNQDGDVTLSVCLPPDPVTSPTAASLGKSLNASQLISWPALCLCVPNTGPVIACLSLAAVLNIVKGLACYCSIWVFRKVRYPEQETTQEAVNVEEQMVQSLREHIQRFSVEKHQRNSRVRTRTDSSLHSVYG